MAGAIVLHYITPGPLQNLMIIWIVKVLSLYYKGKRLIIAQNCLKNKGKEGNIKKAKVKRKNAKLKF